MDNNRVRKRTTNACQRCRQQKIRCSGSHPCVQCTKRKVSCTFEDRSQKIFVTKGYISDLEQRLARFEQLPNHEKGSSIPEASNEIGDDEGDTVDDDDQIDQGDQNDQTQATSTNSQTDNAEGTVRSGYTSPEPPLMNHLASGIPMYIPDRNGNPIYMGTSSNWSFGRRVLAVAHERIIGAPIDIDNLLFQGQVYTLDWQDIPPLSLTDALNNALPSSDFAIYLINSVKFHCGQIFHLFEEEVFMRNFTAYYDSRHHDILHPQIWHVHYLLILALGKAFIVRTGRGDQPPGADLFVLAMKYLPTIVFLHAPTVEVMELLCCAALYLHSLDFRSAAYTLIGQALRLALEKGLHTDMKSQHIDESFAQRSRKIWWTILVLDRQMSALSGLPIAVRDEDISADLPKYPGSPQKEKALRLHITLSNLIAEIVKTVYGAEGRLGREYLANTKSVLRKIADTTDQLNSSFHIPATDSMSGLSRLSAYLHLLHHQSVILAVRPLFYSFFCRRLDGKNPMRCYVPQAGSVRALLVMGIESAQRILRILSALQAEGTLETFLPFDLDSTFSAITVLYMGHAADNRLIQDPQIWSDIAQEIFGEMISRGNKVANCLKSEMEHLRSLLDRLPATVLQTRQSHNRRPSTSQRARHHRMSHGQDSTITVAAAGATVGITNTTSSSSANTITTATSTTLVDPDTMTSEYSVPSVPSVPLQIEDIDWQDGFTTENLMNMADSLDLDGLDWLSNSTFDMMT